MSSRTCLFLVIAIIANTAVSQTSSDSLETTIAEVMTGSDFLCQPKYRYYFKGESSWLASNDDECNFVIQEIQADQLIADLRKLKEWMITAETAKVSFSKTYADSASGKTWSFVSYDHGFGCAYFIRRRDNSSLCLESLRSFGNQILENYDVKYKEHFSFSDPFQ